MNRRMLVVFVGIVLVLHGSLLAGPPVSQAQPDSTPFRIDFLTGTDGTDNTLVVELFGPDAPEPFWRVTVAEGPGDLQPGQLNSYTFPIPVTFCDVVQVHVLKPSNILAGDDAWDIREFYVYVDDTQVAFDRVAYEVFSPFTTTHWPINVNWQGTEAYQLRCGVAALPSVTGDLIPVAPGAFSVINTPVFVLPPSDLNAMPVAAPTAVPSPPAPAQVITCPGFLPSRLQINQQGRVLPGAANNLRSAPMINSQLLGQIPGGSVFSVLEGPSCDQAGIAWWRITVQGLTGWTGEGQGDIYWVEPVP